MIYGRVSLSNGVKSAGYRKREREIVWKCNKSVSICSDTLPHNFVFLYCCCFIDGIPTLLLLPLLLWFCFLYYNKCYCSCCCCRHLNKINYCKKSHINIRDTEIGGTTYTSTEMCIEISS